MNTNLTVEHIIVIAIVFLLAGVLSTRIIANFWSRLLSIVLHQDIPAVKHAYVVVKKNDRIAATCTLTFKEDSVHAQHPVNSPIGNMVGCYKTEISKWGEKDKTPFTYDITFS